MQDINTETAFWIHAYLHRLEGDIDNANYWYNRARKEPYSESLESELNDNIKIVFFVKYFFSNPTQVIIHDAKANIVPSKPKKSHTIKMIPKSE